MKKIILILVLPFFWSISFGQNKAEAERLVEEGIVSHDNGDFDDALSKYDRALKLDKDNLFALIEKGVTLLALQKYEEVIKYSQKAIETHPGHIGLTTVYVTYGNATDGLKKTSRAIEIYDEGIEQFPDFYHLHFNKGISLSSLGRYDEAILCFQKAIRLNPDHAGSHNAIARLSYFRNQRIPALLAYWRFFALEPQGPRANENLSSMLMLIKANVEQTSKDSIVVRYSPDMFGDTTSNGEPGENSFIQTDMILSMDAARDFLKENKNKTEVEKFIRIFETVSASLNENKNDNFGFFWEYYVPYFIEMKEKQLLETYAYIAFASSDDPGVAKWLKAHKDETEKFFKWSATFDWKAE